MRQSMLSDEQTRLLAEEKETLSDILMRLSEIDLSKEALATLQKAILQLNELFLIVVVGEFNAGKSALINALLGEKVLTEGVTPTTTRVTLLKWGEKLSENIYDETFSVITYPLPLLKELNIVDSPGTNAIIRMHEQLTNEFVPRSDLVLFTTSADRPLTESERQFLGRILAWGKKVIFVLNKADILGDTHQLQETKDFIIKHVTLTLGEPPVLIPVSARFAQRAALETEETEHLRLRSASNFDELEQYISVSLDDATRLQLKLKNPLGVAENLVDQAENLVKTQSNDLKEDVLTVKSLETTINGYEHDLKIELAPRLAEVENILHKFEMRGLDFFDRNLRLTNIHNLIRGDRVRAAFEKEVLTDVSDQIDDQVQRIIDWLVEKDIFEWQQVMTYLQRRQSLSFDQIVSGGSSPQAAHRRELIDKVGQRVTSIIESYDRVKEASHLAAGVESAVAQTALFEVGAVGLGALVSTALLSSALDITGTIAAGTLAIVGLFVIPYKRKQVKEDFRKKITVLRTSLNDTLTTAFTAESEKAITHLRENIAPYTRFVHAEQSRISAAQEIVDDLRRQIARLGAQVDSVVKVKHE